MPFAINDFKGAISRRAGIMRPNKFLFQFGLPPVMMVGEGPSFFGPLARDMEFWCDSVNLPGYQLGTSITRRWSYGPDEKRPYGPIYLPIQAQFNSDTHGAYLNFFNIWMQTIMPHDWYNGGFSQMSNYSPGRQYELEYKERYATDLEIHVYDAAFTEGEPIVTYFIKEAFPSQIQDMKFDWSDTGNAKFMVTFEYLDWTTTTNNPGGSIEEPSLPLFPPT